MDQLLLETYLRDRKITISAYEEVLREALDELLKKYEKSVKDL